MNIKKIINKKIIIAIILTGTIFFVYHQVSHFEFVSYDDPSYIPYSSRALSLKNIGEVFLSMNYANWHPLTWLSLMFDYNIYGRNAGGYHVTNLILHIINALLLFFLLDKMTGATYRSAFAAFLFALHPLHVESVAWVTERKDVLSTMFWLMTMWAYALYSEKPGMRRYFPVIVFFVMGLMSKPMLVTLPLVLLLIDYWPLGRVNLGQAVPHRRIFIEEQTVSFLVIEKIPLFVIAIGSCVVTYIAQNAYHAVIPFSRVPLYYRIFNAINSYVGYLWKIFRFHDLSPFYLYSMNFEAWQTGGSLLCLLTATFAAIIFIKKIPYLAVGWFWYLGTLVPVIGLIQVGSQAMADRYTYVPLIGIFIVMAWGASQLLSKLQHGKIIVAAAAFIFIVLISSATYSQVGIWKNDLTLFGHVIALNPKNTDAYQVIGCAMANNGENEKALYYYYMALKYNPRCDKSYVNAGIIFQEMGRLEDAMGCYRKALQINDKSAEADYNLGIALMEKNLLNEAIFHFKRALKLKSDDYDAYNNLGVALMKAGNTQEAISCFQDALRLNPHGTEAEKNMNIAVAVRKEDVLKKSNH